MPSLFDQSTDVCGLTHVLQTVVGDTDQPHTQGDRRIPPVIDHLAEGLGGQTLQNRPSASVHRVVLVDQRLRALRLHRGDVRCLMPETQVPGIRSQAESRRPVIADP